MDATTLYTFCFLFSAAFIAACFDAIAGGGGLLTIPALLMAGFDPLTAIATNKLQGSFGAAAATHSFSKRGLIVWSSKATIMIVCSCLFAAIVGASCVSYVPKDILSATVPLLLIGISIYFMASKQISDTDTRSRMTVGAFAVTVAPAIAFYDGIFGPGAGAFYAAGFVAILGYGLKKANANTKAANLSSNLGGLLVYSIGGSVAWTAGLIMAAGAFLGGRLGAYLALRLGARVVKPLLVTVSCGMAFKLLSNPTNPIYHYISSFFG